VRYRRANIGGATYFFTVNLADRTKPLLVEHVDVLREVIRLVRLKHPFRIDAMVVLPDHLHSIWTLSQDDADFSVRWALIKAGFSRRMPREEAIRRSDLKKRERGIWQRRYWEHLIRNDDDFAKHVDYVHFNPVKHGYVTRAADWKHSSIHRYIQHGLMEEDWGIDVARLAGGCLWRARYLQCWSSRDSAQSTARLRGAPRRQRFLVNSPFGLLLDRPNSYLITFFGILS